METNDENKVVYLRSKELLQNIYKKCKEESVSGLQVPLEQYEDRVMNYTGTPRHILDDVIAEQTDFGKKFDLFEKTIIFDAILKLYKTQMPFSFKDIHDDVQPKIQIPDLYKFTCNLKSSGFFHLKTLNCETIILEDPKLTFERFQYINKINKLRASKKLIYYLDERVIDMSRSFKKPWLSDRDVISDEYIFFHLTSKQGFEKGLFCNHANAEDLSKWVSDILLASMSPFSVIVMDKSPLHGKTVSEPITRHHSKSEMIKWLQNNNIPCTSSMRKAQLYDLITRCPYKESQYSLDLIFKSHGHEVVRLPENFHDLSLTELMWEHVGTKLSSEKEVDTLLKLRSKILSILNTDIPAAVWEHFDSTIEATEKKIFDIDEATEIALNYFEIDVKNVQFD